jgi:mRNA interferase RelE/StbE
MNYDVQLSDKAKKSLKQIDKYQAKIIVSWIKKNLVGCDNPRLHGKALVGNKKGYWRYRVGSYRIIADIDDIKITIELINISHRREVYND